MIIHDEYARALVGHVVNVKLVAVFQLHVYAIELSAVREDEVYVVASDVEHLVLRMGFHHVVAVAEGYPVVLVLAAEHGGILCVGGAISVDRSYRISDPHYHTSKQDEPLARNIYWANEYPVFAVEKLDAISESCAIDTIVTHTAPSFCELTSKTGIANMSIRDEDLTAHVKYERQIMDKILNYLKMKNHPLHHWFYGHFHQSWHQKIDGVQYNMLDIMELREMR